MTQTLQSCLDEAPLLAGTMAGHPKSLGVEQIEALGLADVVRVDLAGSERLENLESQINAVEEIFPKQQLGACVADPGLAIWAADLGVSILWGSLAALRQVAGQVAENKLRGLCWVLSDSHKEPTEALTAKQAASFCERLKQLYIEYPVEKLSNGNSEVAQAVDLRFCSSSSSQSFSGETRQGNTRQAEKVALAVWAMAQQAKLLVTDDVVAVHQARQVCFRKLAA